MPGKVVRRFFKVFEKDLLHKECRLQNLVKPMIDAPGRFYLLGTYGHHSALDHEIAHGLWYVSPEYRRTMMEQIEKLSTDDDMVLLSDDIFSIDPAKIRDVKVVKTFVGGRMTWDSTAAGH